MITIYRKPFIVTVYTSVKWHDRGGCHYTVDLNSLRSQMSVNGCPRLTYSPSDRLTTEREREREPHNRFNKVRSRTDMADTARFITGWLQVGKLSFEFHSASRRQCHSRNIRQLWVPIYAESVGKVPITNTFVKAFCCAYYTSYTARLFFFSLFTLSSSEPRRVTHCGDMTQF